jgi:hypothetical protein
VEGLAVHGFCGFFPIVAIVCIGMLSMPVLVIALVSVVAGSTS